MDLLLFDLEWPPSEVERLTLHEMKFYYERAVAHSKRRGR